MVLILKFIQDFHFLVTLFLTSLPFYLTKGVHLSFKLSRVHIPFIYSLGIL